MHEPVIDVSLRKARSGRTSPDFETKREEFRTMLADSVGAMIQSSTAMNEAGDTRVFTIDLLIKIHDAIAVGVERFGRS